jgi:hypothetical protein
MENQPRPFTLTSSTASDAFSTVWLVGGVTVLAAFWTLRNPPLSAPWSSPKKETARCRRTSPFSGPGNTQGHHQTRSRRQCPSLQAPNSGHHLRPSRSARGRASCVEPKVASTQQPGTPSIHFRVARRRRTGPFEAGVEFRLASDPPVRKGSFTLQRTPA